MSHFAGPGTPPERPRSARTLYAGTLAHRFCARSPPQPLSGHLRPQLPGRTTTSIHWHGIALRSDMDGVPPLTQTAVGAGSSFTYRFIADAPGTYFFHPHVGVRLDRGL